MRKLILRCFQSPGDVLLLTAAVRDLQLSHPNQFLVDVRTSADSLWENNPYLTPLQETAPDVECIDMHYPLIHKSNQRPFHFIHGFAQFLEQRLGLTVPVTQFRADVHLTAEERTTRPELGAALPDRFWIMVAGGKFDFTAKWWSPASYQAVADQLSEFVPFVQCGEQDHWHPLVRGAVNLVGKTSLREFVHLMHHAEGVVCPVTFAMHLAAAVEQPNGNFARPCVVIAGGREPPHWEAYPTHQFLHTVGMLECCQSGGCWKSRCQLVGDGDFKDRRDVCETPVQIAEDLRIPKCMEMIRPEDVVRRIEMHLDSKAFVPLKAENAASRLKTFNHERNGPKNRILIRFRHGLGDLIQLSTVLLHL